MKQTYIFTKKCSAILALLTAASLIGCSSLPEQNPEPLEEVIVLQEPAAEISNTYTEPVVRRNIYKGETYPTMVSPYIEEYSFNTDQQFGSYGPLLGDRVRKGDILMTASGNSLTSQISSLQEKLQDMADDYIEYCTETEEELKELRSKLSQLQGILDNLDRLEPVPTVSENDGELPEDFKESPEYLVWKQEYHRWQGEYNLIDYYITTTERQLEKQEALYILDSQYYSEQLQELLEKRTDEVIRSQISGVVVAMSNYQYTYGDYLPKDQPLIAVADLNRKYLNCEYIRPKLLSTATQLYAFIDGKRYDITVDNPTGSDSLSQTSFRLLDPENEVSVGSYAVVVLLTDYREQVLTVPTNTIQRENSKDIVYVLADGQSIPKEVKIGISNNLYTEILSGLNEGESVLVTKHTDREFKTAVLEKGTSSNERRLGGQLFYPMLTVVKNPITNGNVYLEEYAVEENDTVAAGDPLAIIRVESDPIALSRRELSLQRRKERLADLIAQDREENEETILFTQESIEKEEEALEKIKADYATTQILSTVSGRVFYLKSRSSGEYIPQSNPVATIADESIIYLSVKATNGVSASYGTVLTINYKDSDGEGFTVECPVLTADNSLLSSSLVGDAMVLLPPKARQNINKTNEKPISVSFTSEKMDNVILVPAVAVTTIDSEHYVNVMNEDGSITTVNFLCGGSNKYYYWAIDGLSEGMIICWE